MTTIITIHKGGTGEHTVDLRTHPIPDAWHAAHRSVTNVPGTFTEADRELILELWYLARAMRHHIIDEAASRDPNDHDKGEERHHFANEQ